MLVHVGFAMSKIDEEEVAVTLRLLNGLGQAYSDELSACRIRHHLEGEKEPTACDSSTNTATRRRPGLWPRR